MTAPKYAALAGKLLASTGARGVAPPRPEDRAAAIARAEQAILRRHRGRVVTRWSLAVAAAAVLGFGAERFVHHRESASVAHQTSSGAPSITVVGHAAGNGVTVVETGASSPLSDGKTLSRGSRVVAHAGGEATLSLSTGTELVVEDGGDVSIVDSSGSDQVFAIRAGAVRAHVAKLEPRERFVIRTPDSEVEVRGTSFRVATVPADPACEGGTVTRVTVYEGVVSVRHSGHETRIAAGQEWPSDCPEAHEATPQPTDRRAAANTRQRAVADEAQQSAPEAAQAQAASDLREQNDLFARALAAKRSGATSEAIKGFESFIRRYPSSSLVESALAQRMKLLRSVDRAGAVSAAEQYLARYPHGFARSDAEAIRRDAQ